MVVVIVIWIRRLTRTAMARPEFEPLAGCSPRRGFYLFGQRQLSSRCAPMLSCDPHLTCLYCRCCCCCYTFAHRSLGLPSDACSEFVGARGSRRGDSKVEKSRVAFKRSFTIAAFLMYLLLVLAQSADRPRACLAGRAVRPGIEPRAYSSPRRGFYVFGQWQMAPLCVPAPRARL